MPFQLRIQEMFIQEIKLLIFYKYNYLTNLEICMLPIYLALYSET